MAVLKVLSTPVRTNDDGSKCSILAAYNPAVYQFNKFLGDSVAVTGGGLPSIPGQGDSYKVTWPRTLTAQEQNDIQFESFLLWQGTGSKSTIKATDVETVAGKTVGYFRSVLKYWAGDYFALITTAATDYKLEMTLRSDDGTIVTSNYNPSPLGDIYADISAFCRAVVSPTKRYNKINVTYREMLNGMQEGGTVDAGTITTIYAALDHPNNYGSSMAPEAINGMSRTSKGFFLTYFRNPVMTIGVPFELSFIVGDNVAGKDILFRVEQTDVNGVSIPGTSVVSTMVGVTSTYLISVAITNVIHPQTEQLKVWVDYQGANMIDPIFVKIARPCDNEPSIVIKWINDLGGTEQYRFGYNNSQAVSMSNDVVSTRSIKDYAYGTGSIQVSRKTATSKLTFGVHGTKEVAGFRSLVNGVNIQKYTGSIFAEWVNVILQPGTYDFGDARDIVRDFQFTINEQNKNIQAI